MIKSPSWKISHEIWGHGSPGHIWARGMIFLDSGPMSLVNWLDLLSPWIKFLLRVDFEPDNWDNTRHDCAYMMGFNTVSEIHHLTLKFLSIEEWTFLRYGGTLPFSTGYAFSLLQVPAPDSGVQSIPLSSRKKLLPAHLSDVFYCSSFLGCWSILVHSQIK